MLVLRLIILLIPATIVAKDWTQERARYIIVLKGDSSTRLDFERVMSQIEIHEQRDWEELEMININNLIPIIFATVSEETIEKIRGLPEVKYVEKDQPVYMLPFSSDYNASNWLERPTSDLEYSTDRYNLDIINKPARVCGNSTYSPPNDGTGANIYILDTGINYDHDDFKDRHGNRRAKYGGYEAVLPFKHGWDCEGHGSHCAGIAAGLASGVAKNANLYSIRVLDCDGRGTTSSIIGALDYIAEVHMRNTKKRDFVATIVSMSLGGGVSVSLNTEVNNLVSRGVIVVTASGNNGANACSASPGSAGDNINVGAHSEPQWSLYSGCRNPIESFSNWGKCVDVIAPGRKILSVDYRHNKGYVLGTGTSMACPHVAGAAALIKQNNNLLTAKQVKDEIVKGEARDIDRSELTFPVQLLSYSQRLYVPTYYEHNLK